MQYSASERREIAARLDGMRASIEMILHPSSGIARKRFDEAGRREWFDKEDLKALKAAAELLRGHLRAVGGEQQ